MNRDLSMAAEALTEAMSGRSCSSAWLGYGDVLFLGFGNISFDGVPAGRRGVPQYEIQTNFADWAVDTLGPPVAAVEAEQVGKAVHSLVGQPVSGWQFSGGHGFQVEFGSGLRVRVVPMPDAEFADKDAWSVSLPGGRLVAVSCDGRVAAVDRRKPVCEWFSRAAQ